MIITELQEKLVNTKRGPAKKFVVKTDDGKMFDCFVGDWNKNWSVGQPISVSPEQWSSREWQGKMYYSVNAPRKDDGIPVVLPPAGKHDTSLYDLVNALARDVKRNHEETMAAIESLKKDPLEDVPF